MWRYTYYNVKTQRIVFRCWAKSIWDADAAYAEASQQHPTKVRDITLRIDRGLWFVRWWHSVKHWLEVA
jgi:hypothetical protein